jgi:hypothetical protein
MGIFKSPLLTSLKFSFLCTDRFPVEIFGSLFHLKRFGLLTCFHEECDTPDSSSSLLSFPRTHHETTKSQLVTLDVTGSLSFHIFKLLIQETSFLGISYLRELSIRDAEKSGMLDSISGILQVAAGTIESIIWHNPVVNPGETPFSILDL